MDIRHNFKYPDPMGHWLDENMPNPPLPDPQRWSIVDIDDQYAINFADEHDATLFALVWGGR